jgi:solute carrier family 34 (sodium-dependent phosphate cotransporter)
MPSSPKFSPRTTFWLKIVGIFLDLYLFIVGVSGMGVAFDLFGSDFANRILGATHNPLTALMMGVFATALVQSSSATTSIVVGMVAGGALSLGSAIYMVMGANIGTTVTVIIVSYGSVRKPVEYERALSAAFMHLLFNSMVALVFLPLEYFFHALTHIAEFGQMMFAGVGGMWLTSPMRAATMPTIHFFQHALCDNAVLLLIAMIVITFATLIWLVTLLNSLVMNKVEKFFDNVLFKDWKRAMFLGLIITLVLQSSSVPVALTIPLAGAGVLKLIQIFPFILGTNVGTTITAFLAALATGEKHAIIVACAHVAFNVVGILIIWPIPYVRNIPIRLSVDLARACARARYIPGLMIAFIYFIFPLVLIFILP